MTGADHIFEYAGCGPGSVTLTAATHPYLPNKDDYILEVAGVQLPLADAGGHYPLWSTTMVRYDGMHRGWRIRTRLSSLDRR